MTNPRQVIPAISLFTGSGGLDLGFAREGFDVRVAVEVDPAACETLKANWRGIGQRLIQRRLEDVPTHDVLRVAGLEVGEAGIVFGGPPCQSWCIAGNRLGLADPRGRSVVEFCRVVREAAPATFCLENVPGFLNHHASDVIRLIRDDVNRDRRWSYQVTAQILNAVDYGVPQTRKRVFVVGWRTNGEFYFPPPTHRLRERPRREGEKPLTTVRAALKGLPRPDKPSPIAHRVAATIPERNQKWYGRK